MRKSAFSFHNLNHSMQLLAAKFGSSFRFKAPVSKTLEWLELVVALGLFPVLLEAYEGPVCWLWC